RRRLRRVREDLAAGALSHRARAAARDRSGRRDQCEGEGPEAAADDRPQLRAGARVERIYRADLQVAKLESTICDFKMAEAGRSVRPVRAVRSLVKSVCKPHPM